VENDAGRASSPNPTDAVRFQDMPRDDHRGADPGRTAARDAEILEPRRTPRNLGQHGPTDGRRAGGQQRRVPSPS
jgi:hypothetical protein